MNAIFLEGLRTIVVLSFCVQLETAAAATERTQADVLFEETTKYVDKWAFQKAAKLLTPEKARSIAEEQSRSKKPMYLAVLGYGLVVPGVNLDRQTVLLRNTNSTLPIPGTSDTTSNEDEEFFQDTALEFAFLHNLFLTYFLEVRDKTTLGHVSLEALMDELKIVGSARERLSLESKLRIRAIAESLADCELSKRDLSSTATKPDRTP